MAAPGPHFRWVILKTTSTNILKTPSMHRPLSKAEKTKKKVDATPEAEACGSKVTHRERPLPGARLLQVRR